MSDKSGGFPWGSLAVLLAFAASTQLVPGAFDQLRPTEKERSQPVFEVELEVEARLWEDPFNAVRRHEAERFERCDKLHREADKATACKRAAPSTRQPKVLGRYIFEDYLRQLPNESGAKATATPAPPASPASAASASSDAAPIESLRSGFLVMVVMVPGNAFVGAEESRRRTRYALLSGLQSQGYLPENAERLGLLALPLVPGAAGDPLDGTGGTLLVPLEVLSSDRLSAQRKEQLDQRPKNELYDRVVVVWINETELPSPKLDGLARALDALFVGPDGPGKDDRAALTIIGPSTTDALRTGLLDLRDASRRAAALATRAHEPNPPSRKIGGRNKPIPDYCKDETRESPEPRLHRDWIRRDNDRDVPDNRLERGYWLMAHAQFMNPFSTAPVGMLNVLRNSSPETLQTRLNLDRFLNRQFCRMFDGRFTPALTMTRTIATDDVLLATLVEELKRRLPERDRRVVVITERDSLYTQALQGELERQLTAAGESDDSDKADKVRKADKAASSASSASATGAASPAGNGSAHLVLEEAYFYRGLDGVTTRDTKREDGKPAQARPGGPDRAAPIEWPESRDQLDYLRGIARELKSSETPPGMPPRPIGAIGLLASDVHDKLLILQALRDTFPDRVFFTTDMDSRLTHPRTQAFTRNLLVASSLPLTFPRDAGCKTIEAAPPPPAKPARRASDSATLDGGNPPWRDVYQSSTYLAARLASCRSESCRAAERCAIQQALSAPSLYEIGREDAVVLSGYAKERALGSDSRGWGLASLTLLIIVATGLWIWPGSAAVRAASTTWGLPPGARGVLGLGASGLLILYALVGGLTLGSLIELLWPGTLAPWVIVLASLVSAVAVHLTTMHAPPFHGPCIDHQEDRRARQFRRIGLYVPALWAALAVLAWLQPDDCMDCEPKYWAEGISAWPPHLFHLLALFCVVWTLDRTWSVAKEGLLSDTRWLALPPPNLRAGRALPLRRLSASWWESFGIFGWTAAEAHDRSGGLDARVLWHQYVRRASPLPRALRVALSYVVVIGAIGLIYVAWSDGDVLELPVRGASHRLLIGGTLALCLAGLPLVVVTVGDATWLASRFIRLLGQRRSSYPKDSVNKFARELGPSHAALWETRLARLPEDRALPPTAASPHRHTLLDDWIDVQLVARRTQLVTPLVIAPFVVLALLVVGHSRLFDAWSVNLPICMAAAAYLLGALVLALQLKRAAEHARERALDRMAEDLRWLQGGPVALAPLAGPFKDLIAAVQQERRGAFAPLFEQPLVKALLIPLGGAGGAQLLEYFLLAK